jgi:hypothetical protein
MTALDKLHRLIREKRLEAKLTRAGLADAASQLSDETISEEAVRWIEVACTTTPKATVLRPVAAALKIPWAQILEATGMA